MEERLKNSMKLMTALKTAMMPGIIAGVDQLPSLKTVLIGLVPSICAVGVGNLWGTANNLFTE